MTIDGKATTIHHNGTGGGFYGLRTYSFSSIHLVSPLTKEMISTNNHNGQYQRIIHFILNGHWQQQNKITSEDKHTQHFVTKKDGV